MATTENLINGDGTTTQFSFSFPYIKPEDVRVELQEIDSTKPIIEQIISTTAVTLFTIPSNNPTLIQFNSLSAATNYQAITGAPLANHAVNTGNTIKIRIYRSTSSNQTPATFFSGGAFRPQDLNNNFDSLLYINQEKENQLNQVIAGGIADGSITSAKLADGAVTGSSYTYPAGVVQTIQSRLEQHVSANDFGLVFRSQNNEPSATVAAANSAAVTAAFNAAPYVTIEPPSNTNATLFVTETIVVGTKTLDGRSAGNFGSNGLTIKAHSTMDKTKPLVSVSSSGVVENLELIGNETSPLSNVHEVGLDLGVGSNRVKVKNVRIQYFQKGLRAYNTQNSVIEDCQVKFCPVACLYIDGAENCKFLNCTTDMDKTYTPAMAYDSRNILIVNSDNDNSHSRNLTFQYGINERGNQDLDHCVEKRGAGGAGLNFVDMEMNGGRKSALQCDSTYTLTNAKFSIQGNNLAATTADSSADSDWTDAGPDASGNTLFYPNKNTVNTNLAVAVNGSLAITGYNGKCNNQVIPSISSNQGLVSQDFGYRYDVSKIYNSSGGTFDSSLISTEQCIKINGNNGNQGATFGSELSVSASPMPAQQQLAGRYYVYELYILELVNCTGVTVRAKAGAPIYRIALETFTPDDPTVGGYFKGTAPIPLQTTGGFELTPAGATTGGSFKVKFFNVQMKAGMPR